MSRTMSCTSQLLGHLRTNGRLKCAGVSLIELLIAMTISSVAASAAIHMFSGYGLRFTSQHSTMVSNQELRIALDVFASEIRLAGPGLLVGESPFVRAEREEVEFFANLSGAMTTLTQVAVMGQQDISVETGIGWPKGKQVLLCTVVHCVWNRLAADGRKQVLTVATPIAEQLPMRSAILLLNRVRYYLKEQEDGRLRLMRDVDGGASTLLPDMAGFEMQYVNREGRVTSDTREVVRIRVTIDMGLNNSKLTRDIAIRT